MTNSQVPFIQVNTYRTHEQLEALASQYPNAIIFYSYTGQETGGLTDSAIWAHGKEYKTGGGDARFRVGTANPADYVTANSWTPKPGDFYVKEEAIANTSPVQHTRTAYIYAINANNEMVWQVLDGNVAAENVYFPQGFERTKPWGIKTDSYDQPAVDSGLKGLNLKEVFEYYLVEEKWPSPTTSNGSLKTTDTFDVTDSGCSVSVKLNSSSGNSVSDGGYVLYGNDVYIAGEYSPQLVRTASTTPLVYENSKITGMSYGYGRSATSNQTSSNTSKFAGADIQRAVIDNQNATAGTVTSSLKLGETEKATTTKTAGVDGTTLSTSSTITKPGIGSYTVSVTNTNGASWGRSFSPPGNVQTSNMDSVYYCNNKKKTDSSHSTEAITGKSISLPSSSKSCTPSSATSSFTVYYPIYGNMKNESGITQQASNETIYEFKKLTSNSDSVSWTTSAGWANTDGSYILKYPSTYTAVPKLGTTTLTEGVHYSLSSENKTLGNSEVVAYSILTIYDAKYSGAVTFTVTLNK